METLYGTARVDTTNKLTIANDVAKDKINYYSEVKGKVSKTSSSEFRAIQGEYVNSHIGIEKTIRDLEKYALSEGFSGLHIVCEPTGVYSNLLLRIAHQMGHSTALVNGEVVHKAKVIENNDTGKDDIKDPRIIFMLSQMGKERNYRITPNEYKAIRELNVLYANADEACIRSQNRLHAELIKLFGNFPMKKDFIYSPSGLALHRLYGMNPWKIMEDSHYVFSCKMRAELAKTKNRVTKKTLEKIYKSAKTFSNYPLDSLELEILEQSYQFLLEDRIREKERKDQIRIKTVQIYTDLLETEEIIPVADKEGFSAFQLGQILGETGPLCDFGTKNELYKFAGINLRKRESGKYKGKLKMSKKGRSPLRSILGRIVFASIKQDGKFGEYYHTRKAKGDDSNAKLIANLERRLLKIVFGMAKNKETYNSRKTTECESVYNNAAA